MLSMSTSCLLTNLSDYFYGLNRMFRYSPVTSHRLNVMQIDDTIRIGLKLILRIDSVDMFIDNQEQTLIPIINATENIKLITGTVNRKRMMTRSISCDAHIHYGSTYAAHSPLEELINELMNLKICLSHEQSINIYSRLTGDFDEIIRRSTIEYDISMAYLFKLMLKETLIKGKHITITSDVNQLCDNHTYETIYRYTWRDKFIVICYVLGHIPYIHGALIRSRSTKPSKYGIIDLITALTHPRRVLADHTAYDIAIGSINSRAG